MKELATTYSQRSVRTLLAATLAVFALVAACTLGPVQNAYAATGSISLQYTATDTGEGIDGLDVYAFKVATVEGANYVATPNFKGYTEQLGWAGGKTAVTTDASWLSTQAFNLDTLVRTAAPEPDATATTVGGAAQLSGLDEGLYLVLTVADRTVAASGSAYKYSSNLLQVGGADAALDLEVAPKVEKPADKVVDLKVVKQWKGDTGMEANRPASIKVQLYDGSVAQGDVVELSDANGWNHTWTNLDANTVHDWRVVELEVPAGYTVSYNESEDGTQFTITNTNTLTPITISKQEVGGGPELPGATLIVKDLEGNTIDEWVSGNEPHKVTLAPGVYTLTEITAPDGYDIAETITFRVNENHTTDVLKDGQWADAANTVVMFDAPIEIDEPPTPFNPPKTTEITISKQEVGGGPELPGATLIVRDASGNVVDQWVSTTEPRKVTLSPGTYTLTEITAPDGYDIAETITFRVNEDGTTEVLQDGKWVDAANHVVMFDAPITVPPVTPPNNPPTYPPTTTTVTGKLPQTGQLWWPVPVLLAAGLVSVGAGRVVSSRSRAK